MSFFMSGQDIYENFQNGTGPEGLSASAAVVNEAVGRYQERAEQVRRLRARMEDAWQGTAADAANRGLGPLVTEHDDSGQALYTAQDLTGRQAGSFGDARNSVVPVPPAPGEVDPLAILTDPATAVTYAQRVSAHNQAAQHNVDVMNGYTGASQYNTDRQPTTFGELAGDQTGIAIGSPDVIEVDDAPRPTGGAVDPPPGPGGDVNPRDGGRPTRVDGGETDVSPAGARPAETTPGSFAPVTSGTPVTDQMSGVNRLASGTPSTGFGVPVGSVPLGGGLFRDGNIGASPRGGVLGGGPGMGAGQPGAAARGAVGVAVASGPGRGGVGFGGVPVGGRAQGAEDKEHKAPAYLEGGDPDELFDTDVLTAPPAIGDEEEDE